MAVNAAMWRKAMRVIPRLTKEEWEVLDVVSKWLISTRAAVFIMTEIAAGIGGILAYRNEGFYWPYFLAAMIGLVFAHASNNLLNDFIDFKRGLDKDNYYRAQYGPQPLEHGLMSQRQFNGYITISLLVALAAGAYLVASTGMTTLILLAIGLFFLLFYTWPLKYIGMGELTVILVWGPLMVGGTYYVTTGGIWSWEVAIISLVYSLGPTTVLFGKHTDKLPQDREKGVYTLPSNTWPLYLSAHALQYNKRFGSLFLLGLIADVVLVKTGIY